jgi:hypothetical protein
MIDAFGLGLGSCLVHFLCSNLFFSGIDYYTRHEVVRSLKVYLIDRFCIAFIYWFNFIHTIMGHRACRVFATPGR